MRKETIVLALLFVIAGVLTRTIFHIGENVEFLTSIAIVSGLFLNKRLSYITVFSILIATDFILGNTSIFVFTWTAFLCAPLIGVLLKKAHTNKSFPTQILSTQVSGLIFTIIFFLWTNFGVVITTEIYAKNFAGLMESYEMALPFLRNQIGGNLVFVPVIFLLANFYHKLNLWQHYKQPKLQLD